jgi:transposase
MGHLVMSDKERSRKALMEMVSQGKLKLNQAATQCGLSYRQAKRVYRSYKEKGDAGLVHQARGQNSNREHPHRAIIIACYKDKYEGFGPTLAAEKLLEEDGLQVNHETLREWLLKEKLWHKQRKRSPYRRHRECRAQFGELVQIDGSIHDWLSDGKNSCLINMVDDATSKTHAYLDTGETTKGVFITIWQWIERYGIPLAFYVDLKTVYVSPKAQSFSHVEKACKKLGIGIVKAYSPQAKGRVERKHGVYQDRFVKELKLRKTKTIEGANEILANGFIDNLNKKFEKLPRNTQSAHVPLNKVDLNQILCFEYTRQVRNDWTFTYKNRCYQIEKINGQDVKPNNKIYVREHLDNSISAWFNNKKLTITPLEVRPEIEKPKNPKVVKLTPQAVGRRGRQHSPWGQFNPKWLKKTGTR